MGRRSLGLGASCPDVTPPGQHRIGGFPRFGTHLHRPSPAVPIDRAIGISGALATSFALPVAALATLPRHELIADFHRPLRPPLPRLRRSLLRRSRSNLRHVTWPIGMRVQGSPRWM